MIAPSRGTHTYWADKDPVIFEGVIGLTKDRLFPGSLEYFIGDGVHKYSELPKYGGAEASILSKAYTLVLRDANGKIDSSSIDFPEVPDATSTTKGVVKASINQAGDTVVKADSNGSLDGWKDAIADAIKNPDAGLIKNSDGTLGVDFSNMPTDKFEELLKSLKMQVPLEANLNMYVDKNGANAADTIEDGRGTQAKPFKSIQACINFVTTNYAIGRYTATIFVKQAVYEETLTLPTFTRSSGIIVLRAFDYDSPPTISVHNASNVDCSGGVWYLRRFNLNATYVDPAQGFAHFWGMTSARETGVLHIQGCAYTASYSGDTPTDWCELRVVGSNTGSVVEFNVLQGYQNSFNITKGNMSRINIFHTERKGTIQFPNSNIVDDNIMYDIPCSGEVSYFVTAGGNSIITRITGFNYAQRFTGTMTGNKATVGGYSVVHMPAGVPCSGSATITDNAGLYAEASS